MLINKVLITHIDIYFVSWKLLILLNQNIGLLKIFIYLVIGYEI